MITYRFKYLSDAQQQQARTMFLDAGPDDGYWYYAGTNGRIQCRIRA